MNSMADQTTRGTQGQRDGAREILARLDSKVARLTTELSRVREYLGRRAQGPADAAWLWRRERLDAVRDRLTPVPLLAGPKVILHVMPHSAFAQPAPRLDLKPASFLIFGSGGSPTYNAEGKLIWPENRGAAQRGYAQLSRTGWIEAVRVMRSGLEESPNDQAPEPIYLVHIQRLLLEGVREYLSTLEGLGIVGPVEVAATLRGFNGVALRFDSMHDYGRLWITKSEIAFEPVQFESAAIPPESLPKALRPVLDDLWQTGGWERCPNFDKEGTYREA